MAVVDVRYDVVTWTMIGYQNNYEDEIDLLEDFTDLAVDRLQYEDVLARALDQKFSTADLPLD